MNLALGLLLMNLDWTHLPDLPRPISGQFAGVSGGALIVAGGSYFPTPLFDGGTKTWVDTVYVLDAGATTWRTLKLDRPLAYGGSVSTPDGLVLIGGGDSQRNYSNVFRLRYEAGKLERTELPDLPKPVANTVAAAIGSTIYVAGGQESPSSTEGMNQLWALDLAAAKPAWKVLDPVPGPGRILPIFAAQDGALWLFTGAELLKDAKGQPTRRYLKDGYTWRPGQGWRKLADLPHPLVAALTLPHSKTGVLVINGDDGENAFRIWELKDKHPGFHKEAMLYDVRSGKWTQAGTVPVGLVTTTPVLWNGRIVIPGGEDRPGHRSATVLAAGLNELADKTEIGAHEVALNALPKGIVAHKDLGIIAHESLHGQIVFRSRRDTLYETRAVITPKGDYLLMFPEGKHYGGTEGKGNDMIAMRSKDHGKTWTGPTVAFDIDYSQHGFIPLIPRGTSRIYAFGTQPIPSMYTRENGLQENAPIGFRYSDDDGFAWSKVELIQPKNDPEYRGMSVMRMCETDAGTWLLGTHEGDWSIKPLRTRLYILRSEDKGKTWTLLPDKRPNGWYAEGWDRMDEGRPVNLGKGHVLFMMRTPEGHLWATNSIDDGKTWEKPRPTPLVHPDAPPMIILLSDGKTLAAFHHGRYSLKKYEGLNTSPQVMKDRSEIWVSLSTDEGRTWTEPRFVFANALTPDLPNAFRNYQCSYMDMFLDRGELHLFVPHRWQRVLHLWMKEADLKKLPAKSQLTGRASYNTTSSSAVTAKK